MMQSGENEYTLLNDVEHDRQFVTNIQDGRRNSNRKSVDEQIQAELDNTKGRIATDICPNCHT